jgi:transposase-like protein
MASNEESRRERGQAIAKGEGQVVRLDEFSYEVKSQSGNGDYAVLSTERGWICSCPDHIYRDAKCKHIWAVELSLLLREAVTSQPAVIQPISVQACPYCKSEAIVKKSVRHNKGYSIQRFGCKSCGRRFSFNLGFEGMRATPQVITSAMQLYFTGESFRGVSRVLRLQGANFSHQAVYGWVRKYTSLMERYLEQVKPQLGDTWRTDEMFLMIRGNRKYLFAMMDDETRFRIAQMVSAHKGTSDVRPMFREALEVAGKKPKVLISDGAHNFHRAYNREFWTHFNPRPIHIRDIRLGGEVHNNKMERQNGEWRDREKVMRGLKREDSPVLKGLQIFHTKV